MNRLRLIICPAAVAVVTQVACGSLAPESDGGEAAAADAQDEVAVACDAAAFDAPTAIAELNTAADERGMRLTSDERAAVFSRGTATTMTDVYWASRVTETATFGAPTAITNHPFGYSVLYPTLANGTGSLFVESLCVPQTANGNSSLCRLDNDAGADAWLSSAWSPQFNDPFDLTKTGPFGAGFSAGDGFATADAGQYYYVAASPSDAAATNTIYRTSLGPPATPDASIELGDDAFVVDNPVPSDDELTLYLSYTTANDATPHVAVATRASTDVPFGGLTPRHELDSAEGEYATWISPNRCRLYLTRRVNGQWDLFVASRTP